jgi:phosphoglycerate dehydrogenase-like enzyme
LRGRDLYSKLATPFHLNAAQVKLLIKQKDNDGRLALVPQYLTTAWSIEVVDDEDAGAFAKALIDADAIVSMNWRASPPALKLKLIHLPGAGTDDIDFGAVPPTAAVCNVYGHDISIAEYALAVMLEMAIGVRRMDAALRRDNWFGSHLCGPRHGELHGRTLGIVGYGHIGREAARRAKAFGMKVVACSRNAKPADEFCEHIADMRGFARLIAEADFILVALPLDDSTRGLFDAAAFQKMKPTAVIINVARGPIIDEAALFEACRDKRIAGAAIDTWYNYPPQGTDHAVPSRFPFRDLDNIIMTPHASGWSDALRARRCEGIAENLNRLARGEVLVRVVHSARERD